ncbi:MAG: COR domain-containing protein, partial [archaeon]|nr:COR domain-containing protein [archaeon]
MMNDESPDHLLSRSLPPQRQPSPAQLEPSPRQKRRWRRSHGPARHSSVLGALLPAGASSPGTAASQGGTTSTKTRPQSALSFSAFSPAPLAFSSSSAFSSAFSFGGPSSFTSASGGSFAGLGGRVVTADCECVDLTACPEDLPSGWAPCLGAALVSAEGEKVRDVVADNRGMTAESVCQLLGAAGVSGLRRLSLEASPLGDRGAAALAARLANVSELVVALCDIGPEGVASLAAAMESAGHCGALQVLNLTGNRVGDSGCQALALALRGNNSLRQLVLDSNRISPVGVAALASGLRQNSALQVLSMDRNFLGVSAALLIQRGRDERDEVEQEKGDEEEEKGVPSGLRELSLSSSGLGMEGMIAVFEALMHNTHLQVLLLRAQDPFSIASSEALETALMRHPSLQLLDLSSTHLRSHGVASLTRALSSGGCRALSVLDLSNCALAHCGVQVCERLISAVAAHASLSALCLSNNALSDDGIVSISQVLLHCTTLDLLDLSANALTSASASLLATALAGDSRTLSLCTLLLSGNPLGDDGASFLAPAIASSSSLQTLEMSNCGISDCGARDLFRSLRDNTCLRMLRMDANSFGDDAVEVLTESLRGNRCLTHLHLALCRVTDRGTSLIAALLQDNGLLRWIDLWGNDESTVQRLSRAPPPSQQLDLRDQGITVRLCEEALPFRQQWRHLSSIDLRGNPWIIRIPLSFGELDSAVTKQLLLDVSPQWLPVESRCVASGADTIISYARSLTAGGLLSLQQAKLLVLGGCAVGKTSLVRALCREPSRVALLSTDGVDFWEVTLGEVSFGVWDFAGQHAYRVTHQLFLGPAAVCLLLFRVTDAESACVNELRFWIDSLLSRSGDTHPSILLGATHCDRIASKTGRISRAAAVYRALSALYPRLSLAPPLLLSCAIGWEPAIDRLRHCLSSLAAASPLQAPTCVERVRHAIHILSAVARQRLSAPVCLLAAVVSQLQHTYGPDAEYLERALPSCLRALEHAGEIIVLHHPRSSTVSSCASAAMVLLRPPWVAQLLATVVSATHTFVHRETGVLARDVIVQQLWRDHSRFPPSEHDAFFGILQSLGALYPLDSSRFFVPSRLLQAAPDLALSLPHRVLMMPHGMRRSFRLESPLPVGLMPHLLILFASLGRLVTRWQKGALLECPSSNTWCLLHAGLSDLHLTIRSSDLPQATALLRRLSSAVYHQLSEFYHVPYEVLLRCEADSGCSSSLPSSPSHHPLTNEDGALHCYFPLQKLRAEFLQGREGALTCLPDHLHPISLVRSAPDLLLLDVEPKLRRFSLDQLVELRELGRGGFGRVFLAQLLASPSAFVSSSSSTAPSPASSSS